MRKYILLLMAAGLVQYGANAQTHIVHKHHKKHHSTSHHSVAKSDMHSKHNVKFSDNDARAPYEGKHSKANDGVKKNLNRNMNYQNTSTVLPANNGSVPR